MDLTTLTQALTALGVLLEEDGHAYDVVAIGGGSLLLLGLLDRPTKDLDLVARMEGELLVTAEPLPAPLQTAVQRVAQLLSLDSHWFNTDFRSADNRHSI